MRTLFLAWRYVSHHRKKSVVMALCITLTAYLPITLHWIISDFQVGLTARALATPLVVGARGPRFDLALHALYFRSRIPGEVPYSESKKIKEGGLARSIPIHSRFQAREFPVVGTTLDYFDFRGLRIKEGDPLVMLGDCVVGAKVAQSLGIRPGDRLMTDPENLFDLAGNYPLNMLVRGVLAESYSPDDEAVFVDLKTSWVIAGIGHGHEDLRSADESVVLDRKEGEVVGNAALMLYTEITPKNLESFHLHEEEEDLPLTAIIALPYDQKSETILRGRYQSNDILTQILQPEEVVEEMMEMVFRVKRFFDANMVLVTISTGLLLALIISLSLRLREAEMITLHHLGCGRWTIFLMQASEILLLGLFSLVLTSILVAISVAAAPYVLQAALR